MSDRKAVRAALQELAQEGKAFGSFLGGVELYRSEPGAQPPQPDDEASLGEQVCQKSYLFI